MEGTVDRADGTTGYYRVPVSLMYPDRDPNGFGFVDIVNSADFPSVIDETAPIGQRKIFEPLATSSSKRLSAARRLRLHLRAVGTGWSPRFWGGDYGVIEDGTRWL